MVSEIVSGVVQFVATSSLQCTQDGTTYNVGRSNIQLSSMPCKRCQCPADSPYGTTGQLLCHSIQCPALDCSRSTIPDGQCCPVCSGDCTNQTGIKITNCPSTAVRVSLPASRDEVLYHFTPDTRDCSEQGQRITTTKMPQSDIYAWKEDDSGYQVTVSASVTGTSHSDTCTFTVIPVGKSSLFLLCSQLVNIYCSVFN